MDPNSANQLWSMWTFTIREAGRRVSRAEFEHNMVRWIRMGFKHGRCKVTQRPLGWKVEVLVEGVQANDPAYVASVKKGFADFVRKGWSLGAWGKVECQVMTGEVEQGKPRSQMIEVPSIIMTLVLSLFSVVASAQPYPGWPRSVSPWPWPEIPAPTFGLTELPGPPTIDRLPTQTGNITLSAGSVMRLMPGNHDISGRTWTFNGTASQPVFVVSEPGAVLTGSGSAHILAGQYAVMIGTKWDVFRSVTIRVANFGLRQCEATNRVGGTGNVLSPSLPGTNIVIDRCHIHHNGAQPDDVHAIKTSVAGFERIWVIRNEMHHNGGDSVQWGTVPATEPWPQHIYVAGNWMHHEGENGVDVKGARHVVVVDNDITGMTATVGNDPGRGMVYHDGADDVDVLRNRIWGCEGEGIASTSSLNIEIAYNEVHDVETAGDPDGGIRVYGSNGAHVHHNWSWNNPIAYGFSSNPPVNHHDNLSVPPTNGLPNPVGPPTVQVEVIP